MQPQPLQHRRSRPRLAAGLVVLSLTACGSTALTIPRHSPSAVALRLPSDATKQTASPTPLPTPVPMSAATRPPTPRPATPGHMVRRPSGPTIGGCAVFPANNAWNQDISHAAVDPNSSAYVASIDTFKKFLHPDFGSNLSYGIPFVVVPGSQPFVPITFTAYGSESDPGSSPVPLNAPVEAGSDAHVLVVDSGNCHLYELYSAHRLGAGWDAASGAVFNLGSNACAPTPGPLPTPQVCPSSPAWCATTWWPPG